MNGFSLHIEPPSYTMSVHAVHAGAERNVCNIVVSTEVLQTTTNPSQTLLPVYKLLAYIHSNGTLFFGNNIKYKMGILNLNRKMYFNQKTLTKSIFLKFVYIFINAGIR